MLPEIPTDFSNQTETYTKLNNKTMFENEIFSNFEAIPYVELTNTEKTFEKHHFPNP